MSDKPLIQQELADSLSSVIFKLPQGHQLLYIQVFWQTIVREWPGIDRFRLNKFYMLMRKFQSNCFKLLQSNNWDIEQCKSFASIISKCCLIDAKQPNAIKYHLIEAFIPELEPVIIEPLPTDALVELLEPYVSLVAATLNQVVIAKTKEELFDKLLQKCKEKCLKFNIDPSQITNLLNKFIKERQGSQPNLKALNAYFALFSTEISEKAPLKKRREPDSPQETPKKVKWGKKMIKSTLIVTIAFAKRLPTISIAKPSQNSQEKPLKGSLKVKC